MNRALFSAAKGTWETPREVYDALHAEFRFTLDPCPGGGWDGLLRSWAGERVYCNPPYGRDVYRWLQRAREAELAVFLLPSRTDTEWFHRYALRADEIRFIRGRLRFGGAENVAPFPSMILVYHSRQPKHEAFAGSEL